MQVVSEGRRQNMQEERISIRDLDLKPGYRAERHGAGISLVEPKGYQVARLPWLPVPGETETSDQDRRELCETLLPLVHSILWSVSFSANASRSSING